MNIQLSDHFNYKKLFLFTLQCHLVSVMYLKWLDF